MAKIKVVYSGVSEANNRLQKILREARELSNHIADLQTRIPMEIQSRYQIGEQLHKYYYTYEYDNHGYKTKSSMYDEQGTLTQYTVYNRDENGIILSADTYDSSDALIRTANYG